MELGGGQIMLATPTPEYEGPRKHREHCERANRWSEVPWVIDGVLVLVDDVAAHYARAEHEGDGWIRHPIYAGALLEFPATVLLQPRLAVLIARLFGMGWAVLQARLEEVDVLQRLPEYRDYMTQVPRFFPAVGRGRHSIEANRSRLRHHRRRPDRRAQDRRVPLSGPGALARDLRRHRGPALLRARDLAGPHAHADQPHRGGAERAD